MTILAATALAAEGPGWKLDHVYASLEAFDAARGKTEAALGELGACKGRLGTDAATLHACLAAQYAVAEELGRLQSYAQNHVSEDTRADVWQARGQSVRSLVTRFAEATAWVEPELLALGAGPVEALLAQEPKLAPYATPLRRTLRRGAHVKSAPEERILALSGAMAGAPGDVYQILTYGELPFPTVQLPDGTESRLGPSDYTRLRSHPDPATRKVVFDTFFKAYQGFEQTHGALLSAGVQAHWFQAQARGYPSSVEASLDRDFVPRAVYDTLLAEVNASLPTLHRYLKLRRDMLGVESLTYADLYVPLVKTDRKFPLADSQELAFASAAPLGKAYQEAMREGFDGGWVDAYPRVGKVGGAYMSDSAYGVHPFVLLNHNDDYESATTLAHEFGHAMHSHLAMSTQPYPTAGYSIFVAEVASTFNEALLLDHLLKAAKTDDEKLFYLGSALEQLRTTFYRQAMFAEYELKIHELAERGQPLTGGILTETFAELVRRYHGHDQGLCRVDDAWTHEWQYVPHFYYDFYVYQYATSLAASAQLADEVMDGEKGATQRYLGLLSAGGSDDGYVLLKKAGVDLATPEPYRALVARMNEIMDQIEAIRKKQAKKKK